jgi:glutaredoxin-related protein
MRHELFAAFILSHGRAARVDTYDSLRRSGYTGRVVLLVDDEDATLDDYRARFGDEVETFSKAAAAARFDEADNFGARDRRAVVYARNACFDVAERLGLETFVELDDDYVDFRHKRDGEGRYIHRREIADLDAVFDAILDYYLSIPALSVAMAQGGDFFGGSSGRWDVPKRKAMNSFFCSVSRRFDFRGRVNEDVTTYVLLGSRGDLFLTLPMVALQQRQTQGNEGGMTGLYLDGGTYVKTFYTVVQAPAAVRVSVMGSVYPRIHHEVTWGRAVPKIIPEEFAKWTTAPAPSQS